MTNHPKKESKFLNAEDRLSKETLAGLKMFKEFDDRKYLKILFDILDEANEELIVTQLGEVTIARDKKMFDMFDKQNRRITKILSAQNLTIAKLDLKLEDLKKAIPLDLSEQLTGLKNSIPVNLNQQLIDIKDDLLKLKKKNSFRSIFFRWAAAVIVAVGLAVGIMLYLHSNYKLKTPTEKTNTK